jgi:hypothetical protein
MLLKAHLKCCILLLHSAAQDSVDGESIAKVKRRLFVNIDEQSDDDIHIPATKRRLVDSSVDNKMAIDLTMDLWTSPETPTAGRSILFMVHHH